MPEGRFGKKNLIVNFWEGGWGRSDPAFPPLHFVWSRLRVEMILDEIEEEETHSPLRDGG